MYWIYLVIFVAIVFVPDLVQQGFFTLREESAEELLIFLLGSIGFVIFLLKERQVETGNEEKTKFQREATRMSKDLTSSYSYIGEINRKLEIFKNFALGMPSWSKQSLQKPDEVFEYVIAATRILGKTNEFQICIVNASNGKEILALKSNKRVKFEMSCGDCLEKNKKFIEMDDIIFAIAPEEVDKMTCVIMLKKKNMSHYIEDPDIIKAIASHTLFLYSYMDRRRIKR